MLAVLFFILAESMLAGSLLPHSLSNKFHSNERTNTPNPNSLSPENGRLQCVDCNAMFLYHFLGLCCMLFFNLNCICTLSVSLTTTCLKMIVKTAFFFSKQKIASCLLNYYNNILTAYCSKKQKVVLPFS